MPCSNDGQCLLVLLIDALNQQRLLFQVSLRDFMFPFKSALCFCQKSRLYLSCLHAKRILLSSETTRSLRLDVFVYMQTKQHSILLNLF